MKCLIQYVSSASVTVDHKELGQIKTGYCILVGFGVGDSQINLENMAHKILHLRTIPDKNGKINLSIQDVSGEILLVPQFTHYARTVLYGLILRTEVEKFSLNHA